MAVEYRVTCSGGPGHGRHSVRWEGSDAVKAARALERSNAELEELDPTVHYRARECAPYVLETRTVSAWSKITDG